MSFSCTTTGSFLCLYVAVVPVCNVSVDIFGTLIFVNVVPFNCVIYLRNAKSNSFNFAVNFTGVVFCSLFNSINGCSDSNSIFSVVSVPSTHNVFTVVSCVMFICTFISSTKFLAILI